MTHADLVKLAAHWLRARKRCGVVLTEYRYLSNEFPDAIGWKGGQSWMVECKVSRGDFFADRRKAGRVAGRRLARFCYYMVPRGLVRVDELPPGWGLLEVLNGRAFVARECEASRAVDERGPESLRDEIALLYSELRRYQLQGIRYRDLGKNGGYTGGALGTLHALVKSDREEPR